MAYAEARQFDPAAIPVVDIRPLRDGSNPAQVAAALHAASQNLGFIYIRGHGIPDAVISAARQSALDFFRADEAEKIQITVTAKHRGWLEQGEAKMQDDARTDLKESFIWGYQDAQGNTPEDHELRGRNQWPLQPDKMEAAAMAWLWQADEVARHLLRGFALGLELTEDFFLRSCTQPMHRAAYVYYPTQDETLGSEHFGVGPHTDFGVLTVLSQDDVGGLQVQTVDGDWIHAPPIEGTLLVNVGDLLHRWTDGAYKSTPHRVVNRSGRERLSLVLAFDPDPDTLIDACDVYGANYRAQKPAISCGDYLNWRFGKAFSYRK